MSCTHGKRVEGCENCEAEIATMQASSANSDLLCVYTVLFTDCIYESAYATMSLHRTKKGAIAAMRTFKTDVFYGWQMSEFIGFRYGKLTVVD